jgi:histidinol-phosphate aminotransferase
MFGINLSWFLVLIWALWGIAAVALTGWAVNALIGRIEAARSRIARIAADNGLTALPSAANFVAIDCGGDAARAKAVLEGLIRRGVFVRMPFAAPQNRCIRVSCGTPAQLDAFAAALPEALREAADGAAAG